MSEREELPTLQELADEIETVGLREFVRRRKDIPRLDGKRIVAALRAAAAPAQGVRDRKTLEELIQRHASAYVARGSAISDSIIAECKASREALLAALSTPSTERGYVPYTAEEAEVHIEGYEGHTPSTEREYDPNVAPCDDAEFGMKP